MATSSSLELQILWLGRDAGTGEELVAVTNAGTEMDGYIVQEFVVVAYNHVLVDDAEGTNDIVVAQFSLWVDNS